MFTSIAIIGRPNVGKSTLFNKLTKSRQAIVSDFSGLTKDRNYGYISFGDQKSLVIDTGGIAQDNSILKEDIAEQAWIAAEESSLILFLLDGSQNLTKEDLDILTRLRKLDKKFITALNKIDKKSESRTAKTAARSFSKFFRGTTNLDFRKCIVGAPPRPNTVSRASRTACNRPERSDSLERLWRTT